MFNVKSRKLVLTLFCSLALVLVLTDGVSANAQLDAHRMLRKRSPDVLARDSIASIIPPGTKGDGSDPNQGSGPASSVSSPSSSLPTSSLSSTLSHPSSSSLPASSLSSSSSSSSSVSSSSSSTSTSSTPTQPPSTPTQQNDAPTPTPTSTQSRGQKTEFMTVTSSDTSSTNAAPASTGASTTTKTTLTVLVALAASVGAVVIIWTIIRKWKFKPSDKFEDRMQPIDWQPTSPEEETVPGIHRAASTRSHNSFYSGGHESDHNSSQQHGGSIRRGVTPLPEHDFTPGPSHLAPGAGYADLARGPSPQPQMTQTQEVQYGVPLHHQGAYDSYGTVNGQRF